uniref:Uncharacterized protein n=1 Tax=Oryza barthii TaxID=65489 RepID=A0A0D3GPF7_9ORYZ
MAHRRLLSFDPTTMITLPPPTSPSLGFNLRPSYIFLTVLPALFPTVPTHARHALSAATARRLHARETAGGGDVQDGARGAVGRQAVLAHNGGHSEGGADAGTGIGVPQGHRGRGAQGDVVWHSCTGSSPSPSPSRCSTTCAPTPEHMPPLRARHRPACRPIKLGEEEKRREEEKR